MKPLATLSLDLDDAWSYRKTHGDPGWKELPTYLDRVVPLALEMLAEKGLTITFFIVGQDAARPRHRDVLRAIPAAGHEVGNHSFHHDPWLHRYAREDVEAEIARAEEAILEATGARPVGFRGPGYSVTPDVLEVLWERGYRYDASTLPTFLGPLARAYYFLRADLPAEERRKRGALFGSVRDGFRPLRPYQLQTGEGRLLEIPVTTLPVLRTPFHLSYVLWLSRVQAGMARSYFRNALRVCRLMGVEPSVLVHPLDLLGGDEVEALEFFPGMDLPGAVKRARVASYLDDLGARFQVETLGSYTAMAGERGGLRVRPATWLEHRSEA